MSWFPHVKRTVRPSTLRVRTSGEVEVGEEKGEGDQKDLDLIELLPCWYFCSVRQK